MSSKGSDVGSAGHAGDVEYHFWGRSTRWKKLWQEKGWMGSDWLEQHPGEP